MADSPNANKAADTAGTVSSEPVEAPASAAASRPASSPWALCLLIVNFDVEYGQKIEYTYPPQQFDEETSANMSALVKISSSSLTPHHRSSSAFLSIPDSATVTGDVVYSFKTIHDLGNSKIKHLYGFTFFRQAKDASLSRGFLQKSVVLLSYHNDVNLFKEVVRTIGQSYFQISETILEAAWLNLSAWPAPKLNATIELPILGTVYKVSATGKQTGVYLTSTVAVKSPSPAAGALASKPVELYTSLRGLFSSLWLLWEMVLLGEPLIIASSSPQACSDATIALSSIIRPLEYAGDLKPFFTIHDSDFHKYCDIDLNPDSPSKKTPPAVIIGVTNPYFFKAMETWPHLIIVGNESEKKVTRIKKGGKDRSFRSVTEFKNHVASEYKPFYLPNKDVLKAAKIAAKSGVAADASLAQHFYKLTELFLAPLERYFKSLLPSLDSFTIYTPPPDPRNFKEATFLMQLLDAEKKTKEIAVYRRFIRTKTFVHWYKQRKRAAILQIRKSYAEYLKKVDVATTLKGKSEIEVVDLYLRARSYFEKQTNASTGTTTALFSNEMKKSYREILEQFLACLPVDLQQSLHVKRKAALTASTQVLTDSGSEVGSLPVDTHIEPAADDLNSRTESPARPPRRGAASSTAAEDEDDDDEDEAVGEVSAPNSTED